MKYSGIIENDTANGLGIRTTLFVSGCRKNCYNCFNKEAQNFDFGIEYTKGVENKILYSIDKPYIKGISILGGEPLEPENAEFIYSLVSNLRKRYKDTKDIWIYSGFVFDEIMEFGDIRTDIIRNCDVLVDGPYVDILNNPRKEFAGSDNQRVINLQETFKDPFNNIHLLDI